MCTGTSITYMSKNVIINFHLSPEVTVLDVFRLADARAIEFNLKGILISESRSQVRIKFFGKRRNLKKFCAFMQELHSAV